MQPGRPPPARAQAGGFSPLQPRPPSSTSSSDLSSRSRARRAESTTSEDSTSPISSLFRSSRGPPSQPQQQQQQQRPPTPQSSTPIYASFTSQGPSSSTTSLHSNFSRPSVLSPTAAAAAAAARSVVAAAASHDLSRGTSPLTLPPAIGSSSNSGANSPAASTGRLSSYQLASRKHAHTAPGMFEATLPSTSTNNLPHIVNNMASPQPAPAHRELSASHIAAQAAVLQHQQQQQQPQSQQQPQFQIPQQQQQQQYVQQQHNRQRSQTVPALFGEDHAYQLPNPKRGSGGPLSPPILSLTEASAPQENMFGSSYHSGTPQTQKQTHSPAAQAAANVVFPRVTQHSSTPAQAPQPAPQPPPPAPPLPPKSKVKLFSRPGKIYTKSETKEKPQPSPSKIGSALSSLQRGNFSTTSLDSTANSFYSLANSSSATIRAADAQPEGGEKDKEKKHHFLSRQKNKLKDKSEEYHLPLSSARSNSRPTDPSAPSSLYSFNVPASPGPSSTTFKSMSGLDLRHGGRALREKRKEEQNAESSLSLPAAEWAGPGSLGPAGQSSLYLHDSVDSGKLGLNSIGMDDAWPYLRAKLLVIFEGEDLRPPIEDLNRVVTMHIQYTIAKRLPNLIIEDVRDLLATGFSSLDQALRVTAEEKLVPALVELWIFTFTTVLPYMQAVFLPLDLELAGAGSLMSAEQARDFWGGVLARPQGELGASEKSPVTVSPASTVLDIRRMVLTSFRDRVILPRYDTLKAMFSRLSLEFLPQSLASMALASPMPIPKSDSTGGGGFGSGFGGGFGGSSSSQTAHFSTSPSAESTGSFSLNSVSQSSYLPRPGTAMSLDPAMASYNSTGSTLLGDVGSATIGGGGPGMGVGAGMGSSGNRSRGISNASHGSDGAGGSLLRPFTPSSLQMRSGGVGGFGAGGPGASGLAASLGSLREQNAEDSKQVTEMVGRMLQCMSVLSGIGFVGAADAAGDGGGGDERMSELCRLLKLNWLGRGRTGRNRRGMVGGRARRGGDFLGGFGSVGGAGSSVAFSSTATVREEVSVP
ncbi:hypothetical protein RB596_001664 [Gaeumannomyces avenae]